jgi:hypothetical protein
MARTAIPTSLLVGNGLSSANPVAIDIVNGMSVLNSLPEKTILLVTNTDTNPHVVTLLGGDPTLTAGGWAAQSFSIPASGSAYVGPFTSSRCGQRDGSIYLGFTTGHTGAIAALIFPRGI